MTSSAVSATSWRAPVSLLPARRPRGRPPAVLVPAGRRLAEALAQDLGPRSAEGAEPARGGLRAPFARAERRVVLRREEGRRPTQGGGEEVGLGARRAGP